ncbi:MAG: alanine racemase [Zetaproteobacteria bacterium]|nr:MAG: alanine racemase [Zetaproteobacteria bacterium]
MAVIKADAYGHGLREVAGALLEEGCRDFAVTDAREGARLRALLADHSSHITLLSGIFDEEDARLAKRWALQPAIYDIRQLDWLKRAAFRGDVWLKVDTGMNRLGAQDIEDLCQQCTRQGIRVAGLMSHLACADQPQHPMNQRQADILSALAKRMRLPASLLNTAGLVNLPDYALDAVRPGIGLYGIEPVAGKPLGLRPVMQFGARIVHMRKVRKGESISYGASFVARRSMRVAIVAAGYADGVPRALSNRGSVMLRGQRAPIVGRVCMDYTMIDVSAVRAATGDMVEFWGESLNAVEVAAAAGTIAYELFTGVGARVAREVRDG